ncbi:phage tail spike protein [Cytobacillus kochii]|uniref:phage tail spike protein n=1 Tax=Cytobacillus kochii TaxID=859143 RepID=UPI0024816E98|nr:phage tail spike protein [Cytobacillus kochii]
MLENAYSVSYKKRLNEIWGASFILPLDDPKNAECQPLNYVEIIDDLTGDYIGLFRIVPSQTTKSESNYSIKYECDHVIATLLDDVLFEYHQTINWTTKQNIEYILARQTTKHWRLGRCDFTRYFHYKWEDENGLLGPLFSIAQPFDEQYEWTWDTTSYPWTLNLVRPSNAITCEVRFGKNQREIQRDIDPTGIINRIYPKGYGEGVNQLTIREANNGRPYLENTASIAKYGLIPYVWVDRRFEDINSLKASAQALLDERSVPKVSYRISAVDLSSLTGMDVDKLRIGRIVRIVDPDLGTFEARIVGESKPDMVGSPGDIQLEIANKTENLGTTQADLERRQEINEVYAQGATNIDSHDYNDNADPNNPATIRFYLPEEMVRVNKLELTFETSEFRTYGKATEGGGATSTTTKGGGGTTATSSSGGGTTATSTSGGGVSTSTASGGGSSQTSSSGGGTQTTTSTRNFAQLNLVSGVPQNAIGSENYGNHMHEVQIPGERFNHSHDVSVPSHTHNVSIPSHTHDFNVPNHRHDVSIPNHTHSVTIPDHTHDFTLPNHTHEIQHGIYKLNSTPSRVTIKVDGNTVPHTSTSGQNIDLIPHLGTDSSGKVNRGWHTIEITPNSLGRITAQITTQFFIQSRGGGNY